MWDNLQYWRTNAWQTVQERLRDIDYCPGHFSLFNAMYEVPLDAVRVMFVGQDPYPNKDHATGVAFSVPASIPCDRLPPTLINIFDEYQRDLHYDQPKTGDLTPWCAEGVFLWNAYPSCADGRPGSHQWVEWSYLTKEVIEVVSERGVVIVYLGSKAREFAKYGSAASEIIEVSHPSPLGVNAARNPFKGSRLFSTVNDKLTQMKSPAINWRLP